MRGPSPAFAACWGPRRGRPRQWRGSPGPRWQPLAASPLPSAAVPLRVSCPGPLLRLACLGGGRSGPGYPLLGFGLWGWQKGVPGGGAFHCCEGRLGSGAPPPPTARPLGGLFGSATHVLWARACGCGGPTLSPCPVGAACRVAGPWRSCAGGGAGGGGAPCPSFVRPGGPVGRGVALSRSVPLPSLGRQQSGCHWRRSVHGGRGPLYHSSSCSPAFTGRDLCGVLARWRGLACSPRFLWEPAAGAGGRAALWLLSRAGGGGTIPPASGGGGRGRRGLRGGWGVGGGVASRPPCCPSGWRPAVSHPGPPRVVGALPSGVRARSGTRGRPGVGGDEERPVDRSPGGPCRPEPPLRPPLVGCGHGRVMGGAAFILFWCAAVRRPQAWSARCSGALVWARLSAATPAGAGGWGRWGARCAGPAASPPPPASRSLLGEGGRPLGSEGAEGRSCGPQAGGGGRGGGGGGGAAPPAPPRRRASACHPLSPACPPGVYSCRGGCRAAAGVGRGPVGRQWVSAAGGGEGGGGNPPAPVRAPVFPDPAPEGAAPFAPSRAPPVRRRPAGGRACGRLPRPWCPLTPGAAAPWGGVQGRRFFGPPPSALQPEGEGGGDWGGASGPLAPPPDGRGWAAWRSRPRGAAVGWGVALFPRPPLPRVGPSCRPSLGPLVPPAVVARRWPARGGREG